MITKEMIEEAAQAYYDTTYGTLKTNPFIAEGFRQGAHWAIEEFLRELWYDASEMPKLHRFVLMEVEYHLPCGLSDEFDIVVSSYQSFGWDESNFKRSDYTVTR